jgi:hypothetical protein
VDSGGVVAMLPLFCFHSFEMPIGNAGLLERWLAE